MPANHTQMQVQMLCTGAQVCHYFEFRDHGVNRPPTLARRVSVTRDDTWFQVHEPRLRHFYEHYRWAVLMHSGLDVSMPAPDCIACSADFAKLSPAQGCCSHRGSSGYGSSGGPGGGSGSGSGAFPAPAPRR